MKQEIIRLDQLTMGTIKYSDITLIQEKETEIISSDSLWRGIHEYYNGLVKSNIGNGKKVILQIHSKKEFILENLTLISIIPTIIGLIFSFCKFILSNIEKKNLQIYFSYESVSILYLCGIFIVLFSIISYIDYKNKKSYLYILDYIIENLKALV